MTRVSTIKATSRLLLATLLFACLTALPFPAITNAAPPSILKFDFGSATSPVAAGYLRVANTQLYSAATGYGLDRTATFRDRGTPDDLRRDFTNGVYNFLVDVDNGDYFVKIIAGDAIASNRTTVAIEGMSRGTITSSSGNFTEWSGVVAVADGQMTFAFTQDGRVNAIELVPSVTPANLHVVNTSLTTTPSVTLGWDAVAGATNYTVYRAAEGSSDFAVLGSTTTPEYTDTTVELGMSYVYTVSQTTSAGYESAQSDPLAVAVKDPAVAAPAAPQNLRLVSAQAQGISLAWDAVNTALLYYVFSSDTAGGTFTKVATTTAPAYTDTTSATSANHFYQIIAVNQGGLSPVSNTVKSPVITTPLRQMERIDRGVLAVHTDSGVLVSWRLLGTDPQSITFHVYRNGQKATSAPIATSTNFLDASGAPGDRYSVRPVINGVEQAATAETSAWADTYRDIPLNRPAGGTTPDGVAFTYNANDASIADLDGDGQYEIVLKWDPSNSKDNSQSGYTGEVFLDAYEFDGTQLWRIGMGRNIRAGAHYTQFLVYDFDGDGKAEVVAKTADGTTDAAGTVIGSATADYRNSSGYILSGPEFLSVFNGENGHVLQTVNYEPPRGSVAAWGDSYGNRVDRFIAGVAYLDGKHPSIVMARGYYTRTVLVAYDWNGASLNKRWTFDSNVYGSQYTAQGNHQLSVADVDGDSRDEITYGAMAVDDDGTPLYETGLGHGDAMHLSDLDPSRPGLEVFRVHEHTDAKYGIEFADARTGETIWGIFTGIDTGRGVAADIDPRYLGAEMWAIDGAWNSPTGGLYTASGQKISNTIPPANFAIWWDGDLSRELLDHTFSTATGVGVGTIGKWDYQNNTMVNLLTASGTFSNNSTKGNPTLQADMFGDWREEVLWRTEDSSALRLYTTPYTTNYRFTTLMHDPVYRLGIAWQNIGYNQPPHVGYYLGTGMQAPPQPLIQTGALLNATVDVNPDSWNVKKSGSGPQNATVYIELPQGSSASSITTGSVRLFVDGMPLPTQGPATVGDYDNDGIADLMVKIDGTAAGSILAKYSGSVQLTAAGYLLNGDLFIGSDTVTIKN